MRNPFAGAEFRWNDWNIGHIARHGVEPADAEHAVRFPERNWPRRKGDKWVVRGRAANGRLLQVVFVEDEKSAPWRQVYVIHARPI